MAMNRSRREYERRVHRVVDYIEKHPAEHLSLTRLAQIAAFSPYHFHRVFKSITNETLFDFSQRLRLEKAARALLASANSSITQTAQQHGFASNATFARAFKAHFSMSASDWRAGGYRRWREWRKDSKSGKAVSKMGKASAGRKTDTDRRMKQILPVRVAALPSYRVACMRYTGPYGPVGIPRLWERLRKWQEAREVMGGAAALGIAYDNPNIAAAARCRYDAGVSVPVDFEADKRVHVIDTASGRYAICRFKGTAADIVDVCDRTFSAWVPDSGFEPDDKPLIELYRDALGPDPEKNPLDVELCLPVRALTT
jgi:AraC family transcriptional regulator